MFRVGIGYDVHRLVEGRKLILGGVDIPFEKGLEAHSDGDALMHAICDAVLGALGEKDIGHFFPNNDPRWLGAASRVFLEEAGRQVAFHEATLLNIDATILCEAPKLAPYLESMKDNIAGALHLRHNLVGIKVTTNEGLGSIGRGEGIAAMAVASLEMHR